MSMDVKTMNLKELRRFAAALEEENARLLMDNASMADQLRELNDSLTDMHRARIDPVHAAGGCYCKDCKFYEQYRPEVCELNAKIVGRDDFCSYGEEKEQEAKK